MNQSPMTYELSQNENTDEDTNFWLIMLTKGGVAPLVEQTG